MAGKYVTLSLKVPTRPPTLLHILENSFLEGIVDYKPLKPGVDPRAVRPREVTSAYQLKADVTVIEDELQVTFLAKNIGLHVARIFANTKEVCHSISFTVTASGRVQGLDGPTATGNHQRRGFDEVDGRRSNFFGGSTQSAATTVANSAASTVRAVESEHRLSRGGPSVSQTTDNFSREMVTPSSHNAFDKLLQAKTSSVNSAGGDSSTSPNFLTTEMFKSLSRSSKVKVPNRFGRNVKLRCDVCLRKVKLSKSIGLLDMTFCDSCFTNLFLLRSVIDHFMPPTIKESIIQVPVNKRRTKFATINRELPDINLKGLTTHDVRTAQSEFNKFDIEGDGWLDKVILLPLIKACFNSTIPEPTIRRLLSGDALQSMIKNMELDRRDRVHEIEFLSLIAFVARESHRVTQDMSMTSRFTQHDLAMAYAYQHQRAKSQINPAGQPAHTTTSNYHLYSSAQQTTSGGAAPNKHELEEGVRKSFTESPLTQYAPTESPLAQYTPTAVSTTQDDISPTNFILGNFSSSVKTNENKQEETAEVSTTQQQHEGITNGEEEAREEDPEPLTVLVENEGESILTPPETPRKASFGKQKSQNKEKMEEELKITGDKKADGWMMY